MGKLPAEDYLDKLLNSVNDEKIKKEKFKDTVKVFEDANTFWDSEEDLFSFDGTKEKTVVKEEQKSEQENLLDALLSGAQNTEFGMNRRKLDERPMFSRRVSRSEADFLKEFEAELDGSTDDLTDLFEEFASVVEPEDRLEQEDIQAAHEDESIMLGDVDLASLVNEAAGVMATSGESLELPIVEEEPATVELNPEEIPMDVVDMDAMPVDVFEDLFGGDDDLNMAAEVPEAMSATTPSEGIDLGNLGEEDLMNLLAGADDLADIGNMLSQGEISEIPLEEMDAFTVFAESEMSAQQISADPVPEDTNDSKGKAGKKKLKGGLLGALKNILGSLMKDDEDDEVELKSSKGPSAETLSGENADILAELEGAEGKPSKKDKKKKEKKEKKAKKEKAPKKPKAPKAPKPKKEKKPKEVDNTPPLPKGPVVMIWVMAASMVALVLLGINLIKYNSSVSSAKSLYSQTHYAEAYSKLNGLEIKEKDLEFYTQLAILATVDSEWNNYEVFSQAEVADKAFDSLICAAGRCYINEENADVYGCFGLLETLKKTVSNELAQKYDMTYEEAIEMYTIRDRDDYTIALYKKLTELGIDWE